jgi:hypothetical protein
MTSKPFLVSAMLVAIAAPGQMQAGEVSPADAQAIIAETLRPNGDPVGRPLPLAARWTCHNFTDAKITAPGKKPGITYPFTIARVLDDIAAGHKVMPFLGWPRANAKGGYFEPTEQVVESFRRLAASKLPFEMEAANIEDAMLVVGNRMDPADLVWHQPAATNPAFLDLEQQGEIAVVAEAGATTVRVRGMMSKTALEKGASVLLDSLGRVFLLAEAAAPDKAGAVELTFTTPLTAAVKPGDQVIRVRRKMDFWSAAPADLWAKAGRNMVEQQWGSDAELWKRLAEIYPDPPQVQVVSNNEGGGKTSISEWKSSWHAQRRASEFATTFPEPRLRDPVRLAYAQGYQEKMGAYFSAIREALPWPADRIKLIGYNAFGVNFEVGRWGGWQGYSVPWKGVDQFWWQTWDGAAPDFYAYDWNYATDEHVGSPHIGAMQSYVMLSDRAIRQVPSYLWQIALWDGGMKKRYRYAWSGGVPAGAVVARTAEAIDSSGATSIRIHGATPDSLVMRQGELFSIAGHSQRRPTTVTGTFDGLTIAAGPEAKPVPLALRSSDVGAVPVPGRLSNDAGKVVITGSGLTMRGDLPDAFGFAHQDFSGMRMLQARLADMTNPDRGLISSGDSEAAPPETASHVDKAAIEQERAVSQKISGEASQARCGLMIRDSLATDAAFYAIIRQPDGRLATMWRQANGNDFQWIGHDKMAKGPAGPVHLALTRSADGKKVQATWSGDGKTWQKLHEQTLSFGDKPVAGLMASSWIYLLNSVRTYTARGDVRADDQGSAEIPLAITDQSGPVLVNDAQTAIAADAEIRIHDYMPRYEGLCTMALWLNRPRIVREFAWGDFDGQIEAQWQALMRATDRVWKDPVLTRFWRQGRLVVNPEYEAATGFKHPMNEGVDHSKPPVEPWATLWKQQDRFFQLTVGINPPFAVWPLGNGVSSTGPDNANTTIKVWAIAYELGTAPKREWLLITQSPREDRKAVEVTVPGFGSTTVEVTRQGSFHLLREGQKQASRLVDNR